MLLRLHLTLEGIQAFGELFDVTFTRTTLQRLAAKGARRVGALAVGTYLMLIQRVASNLLASALVARAADFASLVSAVIGDVLTRRRTQLVLGQGVGDGGLLRR